MGQGVQGADPDDDHPGYDGLPVHADIEQHQAVGDHPQQHGAQQGAQHGALPAGQAGAPDDGGRYGVQVEVEPRVGISGVDPPHHDHPGDPGQQAGQGVDVDLAGVDVDARQAGGQLVSAD